MLSFMSIEGCISTRKLSTDSLIHGELRTCDCPTYTLDCVDAIFSSPKKNSCSDLVTYTWVVLDIINPFNFLKVHRHKSLVIQNDFKASRCHCSSFGKLEINTMSLKFSNISMSILAKHAPEPPNLFM